MTRMIKCTVTICGSDVGGVGVGGLFSNQSATEETKKKRNGEFLYSQTESKTSDRGTGKRKGIKGEIKAGAKVWGWEQVKAGLVQVGFRQSVCYFRRAEGGRTRERDGWREGKMNVVN